jgi:hypothetical protein
MTEGVYRRLEVVLHCLDGASGVLEAEDVCWCRWSCTILGSLRWCHAALLNNELAEL